MHEQIGAFPRLTVVVPFKGGESMFGPANVNLTTPHSLWTVVAINKGVTIEDDNAIGGFGVRNR